MFSNEHVAQRLERLEEKIDSLHKLIRERSHAMSASLDALTAEVTAVKTVAASATALVNGFSARLDAAIAAAKAGDDSAALDALSADLKASVDPLAAAVTANTPAAP